MLKNYIAERWLLSGEWILNFREWKRPYFVKTFQYISDVEALFPIPIKKKLPFTLSIAIFSLILRRADQKSLFIQELW